jgi:hypothetical protein
MAKIFAGVARAGVDGEIKLVTLTAPGREAGLVDDESIQAWNAGAAKCWNRLRLMFCRTFPGARVEYFRMGELQRRGAIHYHVLIRGIPYLPQSLLSTLAARAGFGPVCDVRLVHDPGYAVGYVGKYVLKDVDAWPAGVRVYSASNEWKLEWETRPSPLRSYAAYGENGEQYLSVSGYGFDSAATKRHRAELRKAVPT